MSTSIQATKKPRGRPRQYDQLMDQEHQIAVRFPPALLVRLDALAQWLACPRAVLVRDMVERGVSDLEKAQAKR